MANDKVDDVSVIRLQIIYNNLNINNVFIKCALFPFSTAFIISAKIKQNQTPHYLSPSIHTENQSGRSPEVVDGQVVFDTNNLCAWKMCFIVQLCTSLPEIRR